MIAIDSLVSQTLSLRFATIRDSLMVVFKNQGMTDKSLIVRVTAKDEK